MLKTYKPSKLRPKMVLGLTTLALPLSGLNVACGQTESTPTPIVDPDLAAATNAYVASVAALSPAENSRFNNVIGPNEPVMPALVAANYEAPEFSTFNFTDDAAALTGNASANWSQSRPQQIAPLAASQIDPAEKEDELPRALWLRLKPRPNAANQNAIVRNLTPNIVAVKVDFSQLPVAPERTTFAEGVAQTFYLSGTLLNGSLTYTSFINFSTMNLLQYRGNITYRDNSGNAVTNTIIEKFDETFATPILAFSAGIKANAALIDQAAINTITLTIESQNPTQILLTPFNPKLDLTNLRVS